MEYYKYQRFITIIFLIISLQVDFIHTADKSKEKNNTVDLNSNIKGDQTLKQKFHNDKSVIEESINNPFGKNPGIHNNSNTQIKIDAPKIVESSLTNKNLSQQTISNNNVTSATEAFTNTSYEKELNFSECTPPAIKQFPHPGMSPSARRHGGLLIHIIVAIYMFVGLAIVCDEYFVVSLDRICEELKMAPDVAGATFMAAGSSAPELATVIIGVFFAKDDIGISGVIGSAVFNIMIVIAACALCSSAVIYLNWWPLVRDCFFYSISILVMLMVIYDKHINWLESLIMLGTYAVYCVALHFNDRIEKWAQHLPIADIFNRNKRNEESDLITYKSLGDEKRYNSCGFNDETTSKVTDPEFDNLKGPEINQITTVPNNPSSTKMQKNYYVPKEYDYSTIINPLTRPEGGMYVQSRWAIVYPIHLLCQKTMPDCRKEEYRNWYPFTFCISMIWISFYSYFMVWMITIIGYTMGIPDTVMGLTFVAAGVSVPDALSSIAVIKEGYGDMAISNAIGSNVFDILICLGFPWFLKTAIIKPGSNVKVISKGLLYSTLSLLSTVIFLVVATHMNGWKLDKRYGIILLIWYLIFIIFASMYELNLFGQLNPPECPCDW